MSEGSRNRDMVRDRRGLILAWGLPIAIMIMALWFAHPAKTLAWVAALLWMGAACLLNARRCRRTHCYYTGPFFLAMTVPTLLHGFHIFWLGPEGWTWLGLAVGLGSWSIWTISERLLGRYS